jgi:hypothetical protein
MSCPADRLCRGTEMHGRQGPAEMLWPPQVSLRFLQKDRGAPPGRGAPLVTDSGAYPRPLALTATPVHAESAPEERCDASRLLNL